MGLLALDIACVAAYRLRARMSDRVWRFRILLLKYPIFVALLAAAAGTPPPVRLAVAMAVMYAAAVSCYEIHHNRRPTAGALP